SYAHTGPDAIAFLPLTLKEGWPRQLACLLLTYHILVSYLAQSLPLCKHLCPVPYVSLPNSSSSSVPLTSSATATGTLQLPERGAKKKWLVYVCTYIH